ncbi:flagellar protein FlaG [Paenibacillus pasadenensis]|uniref:Flagellin protein FlaG n=1 Tax=Paenibacillus pasadenensis TaxID=217090 RepID=A0A2N5NDN6_9BACL|nr:flagellar protein FlaG [Paenibacillus pasadenensis]PLT48432.1 Flagellin protein FlaG [Paenibacillus pasadenensis]
MSMNVSAYPSMNNSMMQSSVTTASAPSREGIDKSMVINTTDALRLAELRGIKPTVSDEQKIKAVDRAIKAMEGPHTKVEFSVHKETNAIMIKVLNKDTNELIREVPPEKTLDVAAKLMEIAGLLVDTRI